MSYPAWVEGLVNMYRIDNCRQCNWQPEFKSWLRLLVFHFVLKPFQKAWTHLLPSWSFFSWSFWELLSTIYTMFHTLIDRCDPVSWDCRRHWLHLYRGVSPTNECPRYDTKQFDSEASVMLELWGMWSTPSLSLLPGPLWPRVVEPDGSYQ